MALLLYAQRQLRRERVFRDRQNPLEFMDDVDIRRKYTCRLPRNMIVDLCGVVQNRIQNRTRRNHALPVSMQVMIALRFYAVGGFQDPLGQGHGLHKSTVSRCIYRVSAAICSHARDYIHYAQNMDELRSISLKYYEMCGMPRIIGAVDGTLIAIKGPAIEEHLYVCRKGYHALNVQVVADADLIFRDINIRYPGSAHDSYIWNNSSIKTLFQNGDFGIYSLLGDSGYVKFV